MEDTLENKAKFFAQYYGQRVIVDYIHGKTEVTTFSAFTKDGLEKNYIELTPLSQITDEDAYELSVRLMPVIDLNTIILESGIETTKEVIRNYTVSNSLWILPVRFIDKARELGYAVDWNDLSVEKQIEYGWVKLKTTN